MQSPDRRLPIIHGVILAVLCILILTAIFGSDGIAVAVLSGALLYYIFIKLVSMLRH